MADKHTDPEYFDPEEYSLRKRLPRKFPKRKNDIYISRKTDFKSQQGRCMRLLEGGEKELYIHGLGAAVNRAVNLALQLEKCGEGTLDIAVNTSTIELTDDLTPNQDQLEPETRTRNNSAVHIRVYRKNPAALVAGESLTA